MWKKVLSSFWGRILLLYVFWLVLLFILAFIFTQDKILPFSPSYPEAEYLQEIYTYPFIYRLAGFDGVHYLHIAREGYLHIKGIQAFFPLYPLFINLLSYIFSSPLVAGLLLSIFSFYGFLLLLYLLISYNYNQETAWWTVIIFLILPTSFFFVAVYSESLFLFLTLAVFYAYQRKKYYLTSFLGILLSATRIIGVLVPLVLCLDYLLFFLLKEQKWRKIVHYKPIILFSLSSCGLLAYMFYSWWHFQDPFYFYTVQEMFGSGREVGKLILLPQVYFRYGKMLYYGLPLTWKTYAIVQELVLTTIYLYILIKILFKNLYLKKDFYPWTWWFFAVLAFLIPTLTGNFSSIPRYLLVCFVIPLYLAQFYLKHHKIKYFLIFISCLFFILNFLLFLQGYWVA